MQPKRNLTLQLNSKVDEVFLTLNNNRSRQQQEYRQTTLFNIGTYLKHIYQTKKVKVKVAEINVQTMQKNSKLNKIRLKTVTQQQMNGKSQNCLFKKNMNTNFKIFNMDNFSIEKEYLSRNTKLLKQRIIKEKKQTKCQQYQYIFDKKRSEKLWLTNNWNALVIYSQGIEHYYFDQFLKKIAHSDLFVVQIVSPKLRFNDDIDDKTFRNKDEQILDNHKSQCNLKQNHDKQQY
ncbi:unnamed protein product (macronuclear) [Paramecium tetraurelia]|uniref:Uncharacterized protein n=1 Tax=Paramecium tetraurelia TaxID=5888 RepID=A0CTR8_PARTE|nr:uncharacterized protein GSPATT00010419001 [Paramecium tetraurelia]CAK74185.1 unnamed protein product [Paramecium tetraurelia]|eukprot:XP_001441582.1 hypothetical protein (macronuclear) [Paramecium tetraurelia strain d4-2]